MVDWQIPKGSYVSAKKLGYLREQRYVSVGKVPRQDLMGNKKAIYDSCIVSVGKTRKMAQTKKTVQKSCKTVHTDNATSLGGLPFAMGSGSGGGSKGGKVVDTEEKGEGVN